MLEQTYSSLREAATIQLTGLKAPKGEMLLDFDVLIK